MGKSKKYINLFRTIQRYKWVRIAIFFWSITSFYDQLLSQFIPERISKHAPKTWEIIIMTGNLLPFWVWLLILAAILIIALAEYNIRLTRQQNSASEILSEKPEQLRDERLRIRPISNQVFQPIDGKKLAQKWGIKSYNLLNIVKNLLITAYTPDEGTDIVANKDRDDFDGSMSFYQENNEIDEDTVTRFKFKPQDIREFEEKVKNGLLPDYVLLKIKWKRKRKIKKEETKHVAEDKKEDTPKIMVNHLKIEQDVDGAKKVRGLEVENQNIELRDTSVNIKAKNVTETIGASFKQTNKQALTGYAIQCECGKMITYAFSGTPSNLIKCPKCGKEHRIKI